MNNELTRKDIEDMEAEIEHRKVVVRKELLEHVKRLVHRVICLRTLNITPQKKPRIRMRAGSGSWRE